MARARVLNRGRADHERLQTRYYSYITYLVVRPAGALSNPPTKNGKSDGTVAQGIVEESERQAVLTYVVKGMPTELYTELLEGVRMSGQVLSDYA
jgi:hypothetical protein